MIWRTVESLFLWWPAFKVSWMCFSIESPGAVAAAIPPWAFSVALSESFSLVIKSTEPCLAAFKAKLRPAAPEPMTRKSADCDSDFMIVREIFLDFCEKFVFKFV